MAIIVFDGIEFDEDDCFCETCHRWVGGCPCDCLPEGLSFVDGVE